MMHGTLTRYFLTPALLLSLSSGILCAQPQKQKADRHTDFTLVFYNVENLFDTINDPNCQDEEFLPGATNRWDSKKYTKKLENLARVLYHTDSLRLPVIIGLAEIENRTVLNDLVACGDLQKGQYRIVHENSRDPRGIDVALLYRPSAFSLITHHKIRMKDPELDPHRTRECLYVCGVLGGTDTLHLVVNHWKSRSGGTEKTEPLRLAYARVIRKLTDSILAARPHAAIILMGDFNDTPENVSLQTTLGVQNTTEAPAWDHLYNLTAAVAESGEGSHYYKSWEMFDQIIVSGALLKATSTGLHSKPQARPFKRPWMLYKNSSGQMVPDRTYNNGKYYGGYSDHLPVTLQLVRGAKK